VEGRGLFGGGGGGGRGEDSCLFGKPRFPRSDVADSIRASAPPQPMTVYLGRVSGNLKVV